MSEKAEPGRRAVIEIVREELVEAGRRGLTWRELSAILGMHHGQASGALSNLHRTGGAVRLAEARERCGVYVSPENVGDRPWRAHRSNRRASTVTVSRTEIVKALFDVEPCADGDGRACRYCEAGAIVALLSSKGIGT
jgi:hypothetical protein